MNVRVKITVARHEVNVGDIGFVYRGTSRMMAAKKYALYVKMSKEGYGRAAGESVVWFVDGEIFKEYAGAEGGRRRRWPVRNAGAMRISVH